jgi:hypothetical protein
MTLFLINVPLGTSEENRSDDYRMILEQADLPLSEREPVVSPRNGTTVISSHLNRAGELFALGPDGRVVYYDNSNGLGMPTGFPLVTR